MTLSKELLTKLKDEILTDPDNLYGGLKPDEIAKIMSESIVTTTDILYVAPPPPPIVGQKIGVETTIKDAPVFRVISGIPEAPNAFTAQDISDALAS